MKICCISDTHGFHKDLEIPECDILIHAGDVSRRGWESEIDDFLNWFKKQHLATHKILISGNHDFYFEHLTEYPEEEEKQRQRLLSDNIIYLNDSGVEIEGLKIWGSPIQPRFHNWAFNRDRGEEIKKHWDLIPVDTNILITHGPMHGRLDVTRDGIQAGCEELRKKADTLKDLKLHVCGHIHEGYGHYKDKVNYVNASFCNLFYTKFREPIVIEL